VGSQLPSLSFAADIAAASTNRIIFAGSATSEGTITASDKMSWSVIVNAKTKAERKKLKPIREGGKNYFAMVISSEQARDLALDPTYQTIVRSAEKVGAGNPLFTGSMANVHGVIIHSHNKVFNTLGLASGSKWGSGSTVDGAQALMFGSQALGLALLGNMFFRESDKTDYDNRPGIGVGRKLGMLKPQFISLPDGGTREDFGIISVKTAAAA
jgi:N4-gp56 family major capsid protein